MLRALGKLALLVSFGFVACTNSTVAPVKTPVDGYGYGGGDWVWQLLTHSRRNLRVTLGQLVDELGREDLCLLTPPAAGNALNALWSNPSDAQKVYCKEVILGAAAEVLEINSASDEDIFHLTADPLFVLDTLVSPPSERQVVGATKLGHAGKLTFSRPEVVSLYTSSPMAVEAVVDHEFFHKPERPVGAPYNDYSSYAPYTQSYAGQTLLNDIGVSLALMAEKYGTYAGVIKAAQPLAYLRLGEKEGDTVADKMGTIGPSTLEDNVRLGEPGVVADDEDTAIKFVQPGAVPARLLLAPLTGISTTSGHFVTVEFWMKWNGVTPPAGAIPFSFQGNYQLLFAAGAFGFNTGNADLWGTSHASLANRWVHVAAVFINGNPRLSALYIDGTAQALTQKLNTTPTTPKVVSATASVGGWLTDGDYPFPGAIDELAIYNRALNAAQVKAHYKMGVGLYVP